MKIEVTKKAKEESMNCIDSGSHCVCACAIREATGRDVQVGLTGGYFTAPYEFNREFFLLDDAGKRNVESWLRRRSKEFETEPFEISWNPPPKNWSYKTDLPQVSEEQLV